MTLCDSFKKAFFSINNVVSYDKSWANGTGYYNGATRARLPEIEIGQYFRTVDPCTNRRIIGLKMAEGRNAIVFERFTQGSGDIFVVVSNLPRDFSTEGFVSTLSQEAFDYFMNLGTP